MSNHSQNNSLNNSPSLLGKSAVKPPAICQNGDLNGNLDDLNDIPSRRLEEPTAKPPATCPYIPGSDEDKINRYFAKFYNISEEAAALKFPIVRHIPGSDDDPVVKHNRLIAKVYNISEEAAANLYRSRPEDIYPDGILYQIVELIYDITNLIYYIAAFIYDIADRLLFARDAQRFSD